MAHVAITGSNRGIGLELVRQLSKRGDHVTAICRKKTSELSELAGRIIDGVDVAQDAARTQVAEGLDQDVDVLILNAGILRSDSLGKIDYDDLRAQFEVNSLGPLRVVEGALERLKRGSKVAIISSRMGSIDDNGSGSRYGYRMSKAAVNMAGTSLAIDLRPRGIDVAILHPGFVMTDMTGGAGHISPRESAAMLIERIDALGPETSGTFWHANGEVLPW